MQEWMLCHDFIQVLLSESATTEEYDPVMGRTMSGTPGQQAVPHDQVHHEQRVPARPAQNSAHVNEKRKPLTLLRHFMQANLDVHMW